MSITKTLNRNQVTKKISLSGDPGAKFELYIKQGNNYYNFDTNRFQAKEIILKNQEVASNGVYTKNYILPKVTADTSYDIYVRGMPGTKVKEPTTPAQKIGTVYQKGTKTATFTTVSSAASLVVQNSGSAGTDLTGATVSDTTTTINQKGTVTKSGSPLLYAHLIPSWNLATGGDWSNSGYVTATIANVLGNVIVVDDATGIVSGYAVTGAGIIDEITVSAISGTAITLSTAQNLSIGQEVRFSKSAWIFRNIGCDLMQGSGTATITMNVKAAVEQIGIADVTCQLDVDDVISVKPNAYPVPNIECPARGEVDINVVKQCINHLGQGGDNDANVATKTFKIHSIPTTDAPGTSFRTDDDGNAFVLDFVGTSSVSAGSAMGSAGVGEVTYTAHANHIAGDTDFFYYKTVDAQSTPVNSATDQGKISITIV